MSLEPRSSLFHVPFPGAPPWSHVAFLRAELLLSLAVPGPVLSYHQLHLRCGKRTASPKPALGEGELDPFPAPPLCPRSPPSDLPLPQVPHHSGNDLCKPTHTVLALRHQTAQIME